MRNTAVRTLLVVWLSVVSQAAEDKDGTRAAAFSCRGRSPGYYADLETGCQDYHMCDAGGRRYTYSCPNQTRFQQRVMICDHWFMVNCSLSEAHFGANLLIGQKDRQFVEHFQQGSGHNEERSYPSRSRAYNAGPSSSPSSSSSSGAERTRPQGANEIKPALFAKHSPVQSATNKLSEEKDSKTPITNRYYSQFSTPTGSIKTTTTERSLSREITNNPFFRSLAQAPASPADKGGRGSLTYLNPSGTPRTTPAPPPTLPPRRTETTLTQEATPNLRNTPSFPNYQQRRTSTLVTTAVPLTYDYNSVTPEGHSNHLTETETPKLRNTFSKVIPNYEDFTSGPTLTTRYESLKTRERGDVRASPTPATSGPHDHLGVTPSPSPTLNATQSGSPPPTSYGSGQYRPDVTQGAGGLQLTPGGFRFTTVNAARVPDGRLTSFSALVPIVPKKNVSGSGGAPTGSDWASTGRGATSTGSNAVPTGRYGAPTGSSISPTGSGGAPTGSGWVSSGRGGTSTGSVGIPTGSGSASTGSTGASSGQYGAPTGSGSASTGSGSASTGSGWVSSGIVGIPTGSGSASTGSSGASSGQYGAPTGSGWVPSTGSSVAPTDSGGAPNGTAGVPTGSGWVPSSGPGASHVPAKAGLLTDVIPPSAPGEHEVDYNTVEVRIPDPRRMFFIPESAAHEAEMLSSNNETVFKISVPSTRPHGAMRFKGVRGSEGRRADCPQCHPAFLLPGKCQPCVLIRR